MKRITIISLICLGLFAGLPTVASANYWIADDSGGDCSLIGTWDYATKTCKLAGDVNDGLVINSGNIIVDGNGHSLTGPSSDLNYKFGVWIYGSNATVKNLVISSFETGVGTGGAGANITGNTITNCYSAGIMLKNSSGNTVSNNVCRSNYIGLSIVDSGYNTISGNIVENGINMQAANNIIRGNTTNSLHVYGYVNAGYYTGYNEITGNTIGELGLLWSDHNTIYNNNISAISLVSTQGDLWSAYYPVGGNHWAGYDEPSEGCEDANVDGICDVPLAINIYDWWDGHVMGTAVDNKPWITANGWLDSDGDGYPIAIDCNDSDPNEHPGQTWYKDADGDGYSDGTTLITCARPTGYKLATEIMATSGDCNDNNASIHPNAVEIKHDGIDQDCNGYDLAIDIITATFKKDTLTVEATSALNGSANLQLVNYGAMTWRSGLSKWTKTVNGIANPGIVTVTGIEGIESANVTVIK